jgi:hypothetical protein
MSERPRASTATEGSRKPVRRSGTPFDRRRSFGGSNPFQTSADLLRLNVDALVTVYKETIAVTNSMMKGGKANTMLGYFGTLIYMDLLHGGAYDCPINERPYYRGRVQSGKFYPGGTPYDPPDIENLPSEGIADWIASLFSGSGTKPAALYDEILVNANCPHIFPKLLSDEAYGVGRLSLAYAAGTDLFKTAATGIQTLVEAETEFVRGNITEPLEAAGQTAARLAPLLSLLKAGA